MGATVAVTDGEVRLAIPPALVGEPGGYLVRVSQDGAVLFEEDLQVLP